MMESLSGRLALPYTVLFAGVWKLEMKFGAKRLRSCPHADEPAAGGLPLPHRGLGAAVALSMCAAAVVLAGCGFNDGPGALIVDPGRYSVYHCNDLVAQWKVLQTRQKELRGLMDKASEGGGGTVIGTLAYRTDYETVLTQRKLLQREAADKKCDLGMPSSDYQSDQTIR